MKKLLLAGSLLLMTSYLNAQYLVSATEVFSKSGTEIKELLDYWGWETDTMTFNGVVMYKITYNTTDVFGEPTIASGALLVPDIECDTLPFVSWQHGTEFIKSHVPSNGYEGTYGVFFSGRGYITTQPDYLGLGDNPGLHPYIHWESEATASIDLIRAAREFINDTLEILDNNQLFLAGYSQGGHSTMALHKYIDVNNLQDEFNVVASAPMSGPYPTLDVQFAMMLDEDSCYIGSFLLPYVMASYQLVYGNLYEDYNQYYDPPYDSIIADWLESGSHSYEEWSELIPFNFYDFMQDSVLDNIKSNPGHPFNIDLTDNELHNWIPQEPVRMLYCGMDSLIFPENPIMTLDTMTALGANDVQALELDPNADHAGCVFPSHYYALEWFDSLKLDCGLISSIPSSIKQPEISLFPNPFSTSITIEYELTQPETVRIIFYNQIGMQVDVIEKKHQQGFNKVIWAPENLPNGIYHFMLQAGGQVALGKMVLMR